jgi:hypothetical protein
MSGDLTSKQISGALDDYAPWTLPQLALLVENVANCLDAGTSAPPCAAELRGIAKHIRAAVEPPASLPFAWVRDDRPEGVPLIYWYPEQPTMPGDWFPLYRHAPPPDADLETIAVSIENTARVIANGSSQAANDLRIIAEHLRQRSVSHSADDVCDRLERLGGDVLHIHGVDISDQTEDLIRFYRRGGDAVTKEACRSCGWIEGHADYCGRVPDETSACKAFVAPFPEDTCENCSRPHYEHR